MITHNRYNLVTKLNTDALHNPVITLDLHAAQIQGFFDIPTDNLYSAPIITRDIQQRYKNGKTMIVSPDVGGVARARAVAQRIGADLAIVDKRRPKAGVSEVMNIIGDVAGHDCIFIDDIIDSGGTLVNAAEALTKAGATSVAAYVTHGVLSEEAPARIAASKLKELVITDSIAETEGVKAAKNIRHITIAPLIGEAIARTASEQSVSSLFD
jgi:ribose-phosphate pyrophosphokinase